ncbi:MAG TPA: tRNA (adenosine(37)-N6)-threonylcarbamoyltransferase complex transferase subunit TsaD [Phycisphaerales bacterium]|nr:tRNA (adenosine(37)-N6)-threonylcarbamoyltransferase complex transferase subunit TsaD [Phycisphaerales bacterium]
MLLLALETSCDETAAAVVRDGTHVLSNVIASQYDLHAEYAGVVPELASRAHVEAVLPTIREALAQAGIGLGMIDAVAVGNRPGLIGSLLVGVAAAKSLAWSLGKPLVGVDHVRAHLYSGMLNAPDNGDVRPPLPGHSGAEGGAFPALGLVVSGGHTAMYEVRSWTDITRLGATIDDAMGEAYDKVAAMMSLPHPGGPNVDRLARTPGADERVFDLPISRLSPTSLDFSFSGLKTSVLYAIRGVPERAGREKHDAAHAPTTPDQFPSLAASFQRATCAAVTLKLQRAVDQSRERGVTYRTLLTGGGVTANSRLRTDLAAFAQKNALSLRLPALAYCMDNAAMIGGLAEHLLRAGQTSTWDLQAVPTTA